MLKRPNRPQQMRGRGEDVQEQLRQMQEDEKNLGTGTNEQPNPPGGFTLDPMEALQRFQNATTLEEKVGAGQEIQGYLDGGGLDQQTLQQLQNSSEELKVNEYMGLYKMSVDIDKVGKVGWNSVGGITGEQQTLSDEEKNRIVPDSKNQLKQMSNDGTLDPMAQETAKKLDKYLPIGEKFVDRQTDPNTHKIEGNPRQALKDGEYIEKQSGGKVEIKDKGGRVLVKPSESDDPRKLHMVAQGIQQYLTPGRTQQQDEKSGLIFAQDIANGSKLVGDITEEFISRAKTIDQTRIEGVMDHGNREVENYRQQDKQRMERDEERKQKGLDNKPKKKLFGIFGKKKSKGEVGFNE